MAKESDRKPIDSKESEARPENKGTETKGLGRGMPKKESPVKTPWKHWWKDGRWIAIIAGIVVLLITLVLLTVAAVYGRNSDTASPEPSKSAEKFHYKEEIKDLRAQIKRSPKDADLHAALGERLIGVGDNKAGAQEIRKAIKLGEDTAQNYINLAGALRLSGDLDGAYENYQKAIKRDSDSYNSYLSFSSFLVEEKKDYLGAVDVLNQGIERFPDDPQMLYNKATFLGYLGDKAAALETVRKIISQQGDYPGAKQLEEKLTR